MKLEEIYEGIKLTIQEATGNLIGRLKFQWIKAGSPTDKNRNERYYDESIIKKIIKQFNSKNAHIAGQVNHPIEGKTKLDKVSHVLTKLYFDEKTKIGHAEAAILNTSSGRDLKVVAQQSLKDLGTSLRGFGNIEKDGRIKEDDYQFETIDVILKPSFKNATIGAGNLFESGNRHFEEEEKFDVDIIQFNMLVEKMMNDIYEQIPNTSNLHEEREKFHNENWVKYAAIIEEQLEKKGLKIEEPKEAKKAKAEVYTSEERMYDEALQSGYDRPFETFKSEILPAINIEEEENLRAEFSEYRQSGGLRSFKEFKKLKE